MDELFISKNTPYMTAIWKEARRSDRLQALPRQMLDCTDGKQNCKKKLIT